MLKTTGVCTTYPQAYIDESIEHDFSVKSRMSQSAQHVRHDYKFLALYKTIKYEYSLSCYDAQPISFSRYCCSAIFLQLKVCKIACKLEPEPPSPPRTLHIFRQKQPKIIFVFYLKTLSFCVFIHCRLLLLSARASQTTCRTCRRET